MGATAEDSHRSSFYGNGALVSDERCVQLTVLEIVQCGTLDVFGV